VTREILRTYLEIKSILDLKESIILSNNSKVKLVNLKDFQLNKFFYKHIGKKYYWTDRLQWSDQKWIDYVLSKSIFTYILKYNDELVGYFEIIFHEEKQESEIAYLGILEEYFEKKLGGYLLGEAIKKSFLLNIKRAWVHTSSLDHKNALKNYLSRGMTIFKSETILSNVSS